MPHGNTRTTLFVPPVTPYAVSGNGYEVVDADGRSLIDLHSNYTTLVHGHRDPIVHAAIEDALSRGVSFGMQTEAEVLLAEELTARIGAVDLIRFANSGTEAVMMAVRAARAHTGRDRILRFRGAYHGTHDAFLDAGAPGQTRAVTSDTLTVSVDVDTFERAFDANADQLAAVIVDLMPNRAGLVPMPEELIDSVRRRTHKHGVVLIVDEVITFRLAWGGFQERYGLEPDLTTLGKLIGGGFPVGAFGGRGDIMERFDPARNDRVDHGGTFTANPVSMAAGLAAVRRLDVAAIEEINRRGDQLRSRLSALGFQVNGTCSLLRIMDTDPAALWRQFYEAGLLLANNGLIAVSTAMDESVIDEIIARASRVAAADRTRGQMQ